MSSAFGMKRWLVNVATLLSLSLLATFVTTANAAPPARISDIRSTDHNFSTSGTGDVKATTESQICVFCHTPHQAENIPGAPLWNRKASGATYTPYTSDSIQADDIAATPGGSSKLCLSCHDGTIALGSVNVANVQEDVTIALSGTGAGGTIPSDAGADTGFTRRLGVDLSNDHPISFTYGSILASADGELRNPAVAVDTDSNKLIANRSPGVSPLVPLESDKVQCTSCHDPHIRDVDITKNIKFLRLNRFQAVNPAGGDFLEATDQICLACHNKLGTAWSESAHADQAAADELYSPAASTLREFPDNLPVWQAGCLNCHDTHSVQGSRRLLREGTDSISKPKTGGSAALEEACYTCHSADGAVLAGQGGATFEVPNIKSDFESTTHMPITTADQQSTSEVHSIEDADFVENKTNLNNSNRHVECTDCHNPHRVTKNQLFNRSGAATSGTHKHAAGHTNIASGVLRGAWGVEPSYGAANFGTLPTLHTVKKGDGGSGASTAVNSGHVTREYQICFKCHSDYAYGSTPPALGSTTGNTSSGASNGLTDYTNQAMEFQAPIAHRGEVTTTDSGADSSYSSNNHRSWHPVMGKTGRTITVKNSAQTSDWLAPWNVEADIGNQTMFCSDCHGSNTANGTVVPTNGENGAPWGPHGSNNKFILKGDWSTSTGSNNSGLCFKCHNYTDYGTDQNEGDPGTGFCCGKDNLHAFHVKRIGPLRCNWCHVAVPHGWKNKALLVNLNDVGPEAGLAAGTEVSNSGGYTKGPYYNNAMLKVLSFAKSGSWSESDCGSESGQGGKDWMGDTCDNPP